MKQRNARSRRATIGGLIAVVLCVAGFAPSAGADWSPPSNIAGPGDSSYYKVVQYDGAGNGYLLYLRNVGSGTMQVVLRERPAGGGPWGPVTPLSLTPTPGPNGFDAAVNATGDIVVAYNSGGQIEVTRRPANGAWTPPVGYNSPGTSGPNSGFGLVPSVDVGDDGTALVSWSAYNSCCGNVTQWRVLGAAYRPGIGWDATPQVWSTSTSDVHSYPAATVESSGNGIVAFAARNASSQDELWTVDFTSGAWAAPVLRSTAGFGSNDTVDADSRGTTSAIAWSRGLTINAISRTSGAWSSASTLSGNQNGSAPTVAVGATDTVYVGYSEQGGNAGVFVGTRPAGGFFTTQRLASGYGASIAANALGDVAIAWTNYVAPSPYAFMMLKPAGGSFPALPTQLTTTAQPNGGDTLPKVAVDAWGHALVAAFPAPNGYGTEIVHSIETRDAATEPAVTGPSISPATAHVGDALTCSPGTFGGTPPFRYGYEWLQNGITISGASSSTYTVRSGDEGEGISCGVTATNEAGSASAGSDELFIDYTAPDNTVAPSLVGTVQAGQTLTCDPGTWTGYPTPDLTFAWMRNGVAVANEEADTYDIRLSDQGKTIGCRVTGTNPGGVDMAASAAPTVPAVVNPTNTVAPSITGPTKVAIGSVLTCKPGTWHGQPTPTLSYFWLQDGATIAYGNTYTVDPSDAGTTLSCEVSGENAGGELTVQSSNSRVAEPEPVNKTLPIVGKAAGSTWSINGIASCAKGSWSYAQTYTYRWFRDGILINSQTAATMQLGPADAGSGISCEVTGNGRMGTGVATSMPKQLPTAPVATVAPSITGIPRPTKVLTCVRGTWTSATSYAFSWQRNGLSVGGTTNKYTVQPADVGTSITCAVAATGPGGTNTAYAPGRTVTP